VGGGDRSAYPLRLDAIYKFFPGNVFLPDATGTPMTPGLEARQQVLCVRAGLRLF
jgi:hypothetical protein